MKVTEAEMVSTHLEVTEEVTEVDMEHTEEVTEVDMEQLPALCDHDVRMTITDSQHVYHNTVASRHFPRKKC